MLLNGITPDFSVSARMSPLRRFDPFTKPSANDRLFAHSGRRPELEARSTASTPVQAVIDLNEKVAAPHEMKVCLRPAELVPWI